MRTEDGYIIHKCLGGDPDAFGLLVDKYKASIYSLAYYKLGNFHDAEELTQEVFIKAYQKLRTLKRYDSFLAWLYAITANFCRNWIQSQARQPRHESIEDNGPEILDSLSILSYRNRAADESLSDSLHEALDSLSEMHRQVLTLHYLGGMTTNEMARFLGTSPNTIMQRLHRARAKLRQEMVTMMSRTFEKRRLQSSFTLRIMNAVKKMKIQPMPRTTGLPWGLSLATGIMITFLSLAPQPSMFSRVATGSPFPGETKVVENGEIPVDIMKVFQVPILAGEQGDGNSAERKPLNPQPATLVAVESGDDTPTKGIAADKDVIIDPETGIKYTKIKTLVGKKDVITWSSSRLNLSPNGKFLLWHKTVIPLDDGDPFDLVDMPAYDGIWSPDGKKVVFWSAGTVWLIPVSPETGRPMGPARKPIDGGYWHQRFCWSPDSERIAVERRNGEAPGDIYALSVEDGTLTQITNDPVREYYASWSPDGKNIAYNRGYELWVSPAEGGAPRRICDKGRAYPFSWSPDSEWLVCSSEVELRFFNLADGRELDATPPWRAVGRVENHFGWQSDGKMLFYRPSYEPKPALKVVSASGGSSLELGRECWLSWPYTQFWSSDSRSMIALAEDGDGRGFWIMPLTGSSPFLLELDVSVAGKPLPLYSSPDRSKLAFVVPRGDETEDLYVVPVSLQDGRTTGPAVMVFSGWDRKHYHYRAFSWSPDGTRIALCHKWNIWMASTDGSEPVQVTTSRQTGHRVWPGWSPDGKMISYTEVHSQKERTFRVISASGNDETVILDIKGDYTWSPDSRELVSFSQGTLSAISIADGKSRQVLDLRELNIDNAWSFCWSPDRQNLAFLASKDTESKASYHVFVGAAEGGEFTDFAADDPGKKYLLQWSPDGKWISYTCYEEVKTRPEGEIWSADVSEFLQQPGE